jgi:hypothetical protein
MRGWVFAVALGCSGPAPTLVQLTVVSAWNDASSTLADRVVTWQREFPDVEFEQFLLEGSAMGMPATQTDLDAWRAAHPGVPVKLFAPNVVPVSFDPDAVPLVVYVDPKTNDTIATAVGVPTDDDVAAMRER